jgi:ABC-type lipoprotein release transport system permease subunit
LFLLLRMGWRNLFRNGRRTLLTSSIIALGLASLILTDAVIQGMVRNMVATATDSFMGQAQVHADGFRLEGKPEQTVRDLPRVESVLEGDPSVGAFCERTAATAMVASAADAESVMLYGIDPQKEDGVSRIRQAVREGSDLDGTRGDGILLGDRLARRLQAEVGDRIVVTCAKAGSGELSQVLFRVKGIFSFHSAAMDRNMAFVGLDRGRDLLGVGPEAQEVALRFKKGDGSEPFHRALYRELDRGGNEALDWSRLMPDLKSAADLSGFSSAVLAALLAALVALAILNTLFMALYERLFEFGVLRALGTRPGRLAGLVVAEAACMGLLSVLMGTALGMSATAILAKTGINYSGIEFAGVTFQQAIFPRARALQYTWIPAGVWAFTVLIACYPAWHASKIVPAKALHRSLG